MPSKTRAQQAAYQRKHYAKNPQYYKDAAKKRNKELGEWFREYKSTLSCKCGESHPAALDFHHRDPTQKEFEISTIVGNGWSQKKILAEVAKCDVLCANCHRKLHYNERIISSAG